MSFKDYFSGHAQQYARARPSYPQDLFDYLFQVTIDHGAAWDCATGNGQTAVALASGFDTVIATDGSEQQIANAKPHDNIEYRAAIAENSLLAPVSIDLVTVSQALHWFNLELFFAEVDRVLKPGGVLAVWSYGIHSIDDYVDSVVDELYRVTLRDYWTGERKMVEQGYSGIQFPFKALSPPELSMSVQWSQNQLEDYLRSWSATQKYQQDKGIDPVMMLSPALTEAWTGELMQVRWPLTLIVRRKPV